MTNQQLSEKLSDHSIGNLLNAIEAVKSIKNNGEKVSSTNEQLIVAIFGLENIGQISKIVNGDTELLDKYNKELTTKDTNNKINVATVKTYSSDDKINPLRIISAGKQIKNVFYCIMMNMLLVLINVGYILIAEEYNKTLMIFSLVFALIFTIMELVNLSGAGDDLIDCQKPD